MRMQGLLSLARHYVIAPQQARVAGKRRSSSEAGELEQSSDPAAAHSALSPGAGAPVAPMGRTDRCGARSAGSAGSAGSAAQIPAGLKFVRLAKVCIGVGVCPPP
jgi:hypothetical protein